MKVVPCVFCGFEIEVIGVIGRGDTCPSCGKNLRCCLQCKLYDASMNNHCKEIMAERVVDKEAANFCNHFTFGGQRLTGSEKDRVSDAKKKLEELFKR